MWKEKRRVGLAKLRKTTKKVGSKKKGMFNADELNAYKVAYGSPIGYEDVLIHVCMPGVIFAVFMTLQLYYWWLSLICFVIGCVYGWRVNLPKVVKRNYEVNSFNERNKWINNLTLVLTDQSKTVNQALSIVRSRAKGEFKTDLSQLEARLSKADRGKIREGYRKLADKYSDDVIFGQYCEQLETASIEGKSNIETLKDIKTYHNQLKEKQEAFQRQKDEHYDGMKTLAGLLIIVYLAIPFSAGWEMFFESYARNIAGYISTVIYTIIMVRFYVRYMKLYYDDSVMEVDV